jgi:hypothetical protein
MIFFELRIREGEGGRARERGVGRKEGGKGRREGGRREGRRREGGRRGYTVPSLSEFIPRPLSMLLEGRLSRFGLDLAERGDV